MAPALGHRTTNHSPVTAVASVAAVASDVAVAVASSDVVFVVVVAVVVVVFSLLQPLHLDTQPPTTLLGSSGTMVTVYCS